MVLVDMVFLQINLVNSQWTIVGGQVLKHVI